MPAKIDAQQWLTKWGSRLNAASAEIKTGVQAVTTAPGVSAAKAKDLWLANLQAAANKWATNVAAVSLSAWQSAMVNKGIGRIAAGVTTAQQDKQGVIGNLLNVVYAGQAMVNQTPRGSIETNIQRAVSMMQYMHTHSAGIKTGGK